MNNKQAKVISDYIDLHKGAIRSHAVIQPDLMEWFLNAIESDNVTQIDDACILEISSHLSKSGNPVIFEFERGLFYDY